MIDPQKYGMSFSLKQCRNFNLDPKATLQWLLENGWRRFRLMSYWNEHEKAQGIYDFTELDWQLAMIERYNGVVTLCLGVKQPRWPEYHWPNWAKKLTRQQKTKSLLAFVTATIQHVKHHPSILAYQLENEALLTNFGRDIDIDRSRLRQEFDTVCKIDTKPICMSTSNGWGVPLRQPIPDAVSFSVYTTMFKNGTYQTTIQKPWLHQLRRQLIRFLLHRPVFIHELQCEPWGHTAIWKMTTKEQNRSMSTKQIQKNIEWAKKIGAYPIDLWGAEWWYWRWLHNDESIYNTVRKSIDSFTPN